LSPRTPTSLTTPCANLLLARPGAADDELHTVLTQIQLDELVERPPHVVSRARSVSRGSRSRAASASVSVARALLKNAPLLVLDEPTANLDPATERELLDAVNRPLQDRATLVITHRLVRMEQIEEILVLERGRIADRGTHAELEARHGT
jgi:ATP-binding cassette subfamily C protein CydC